MSIYNIDGEVLDGAKTANSVTVAASNSTQSDKGCADYICTGTNDGLIIQNAIDSLSSKGGTVYLATGDYYLDTWQYVSGSIKNALSIKSGTQRAVKISGMSFPMRKNNSHDLTNTAILRLTSTAISALSGSETRVSVIGYGGSSRTYPAYTLNVENIGITFADNQHPIIAVDGKFFSAMLVKNVFCGIDTVNYTGTDGAVDYDYPIENCIAIRGLEGSNFGAGYRISNCFVWGFGTAYLLNGEHLIAEQLGCRFCNYSYKFGYDHTIGTMVHDNTLINCCHEFCSRFPAFYGSNSKLQAINFYDYNAEDDSSSQFKTIARATEETQGAYRGRVYYTCAGTGSFANNNNEFFASGSGANFEVKNTAFPS